MMTEMASPPPSANHGYRLGVAAVLCAFLVTIPLSAQTLRITPASGAPGQSVAVELSWDAPPESTTSAVQWEALFPAQLLEEDASGTVVGRAAEESGKTLTCAPRTVYAYSCLLAGGKMAVANGPIAVFHFRIRNDAHPGQTTFRVEKAQAVSRELNKIILPDVQAAITVQERQPIPRRTEPAHAEQSTAAYASVENHLRAMHESRTTVNFSQARGILAQAQDSLRKAETSAAAILISSARPEAGRAVAAAKRPPQVPPTKVTLTAGTKSADAHNQLGRDLLNQGKYAEAIQELTQAIVQQPDFSQALNARGFAFYLRKDLPKALQDLDEAIRLNPNYQNAYQNRSLARKAAGDQAGSAADREKAARQGK
jgi:Flp pilus assembly protein TadD